VLDLTLPLGFGFLLVLFRTAGLCVAAPVLSATAVPVRIRLGVAVALSIAVFTGAGMPQVPLPSSLLGLAGASLVETAIGLTAGLCARLLLEAAQAAGAAAGLSAGLGYGALIDPFNGAAASVAGQLFSILALGIAVAANLHGEAVAWLARSVATHPPGQPFELLRLAQTVIATGVLACSLSIRLAMPFLAAALMAHAALGVLNRTTPTVNVTSVGFSLSLAAGGAAMYFAAPAAAEAAARAAISVFSQG
jgi:flagellar biosynthetic protein FliR